jgi:hypothetical protein
MICELCTNNKLHTLNEHDLAIHIKNCPWCAEYEEWDAKMMQQAAQLKPLKVTEDLWDKIEAKLLQQQVQKQRRAKILNYKTWLIAASLFLAIISTALVLFFQSTDFSDNILSRAALIKVELNERSYIKSIETLEKSADSKLSQLDTELFLLYKDKLATIDSQIKQCRQAIEKNPGNAHIRRYLLAALQDKKETLKEIINLNAES